MALNNSALFRTATRFTQLFIAPKRTKADSDLGQRADRVLLTVKGASAQTANLVELQDSTGAVLASFSAAGVPTLPAGSIAAAALTALSIPESALVASSTVGLGALRVAHMKYSFAVDGGAVGEIIPASSPTLPAKAIIIGGVANVTTALLAAGGAANISIGTLAGSAVDALKVATAKATYALNAILALTPVFTAATAVKMSASGQMSITVDTNALTAGVMEVFAVYFVSGT